MIMFHVNLPGWKCSWSRAPLFLLRLSCRKPGNTSPRPIFSRYQNSNYSKSPQLQVESQFSANFRQNEFCPGFTWFPPQKKRFLQHITGVSINLNEIRVHLCHGVGKLMQSEATPNHRNVQQKCTVSQVKWSETIDSMSARTSILRNKYYNLYPQGLRNKYYNLYTYIYIYIGVIHYGGNPENHWVKPEGPIPLIAFLEYWNAFLGNLSQTLSFQSGFLSHLRRHFVGHVGMSDHMNGQKSVI